MQFDTPEDALEAGGALDVRIALEIMGWHVNAYHGFSTTDGHETGYAVAGAPDTLHLQPWRPSTDIGAAWLALEKQRLLIASFSDLGWVCGTGQVREDYNFRPRFIHAHVAAHAATAPLAICRAALKMRYLDHLKGNRMGDTAVRPTGAN